MIQWSSLFNSLVKQKQWRDEHDNADCIPDPEMKPSLGKTAPGDNPRGGVGCDKPARDEPGTDGRHNQKLDDIRASANARLKAGAQRS